MALVVILDRTRCEVIQYPLPQRGR